MKRKWLLFALALSLFLPTFTGNSSVQAQGPSSQSYTDSGSSISWVITEPRNQTYNMASLNLSITVDTLMAALTNVSYSIDGKARTFLRMIGEKTADDPITQLRRGYAQLPPLSDGAHKITVYVDGWAGFPSKTIPTQKTVIYIEINTATTVWDNYTHGNGATIYSPCNQTYDGNEIITIKASSPTLGGANIIYKGTYTVDDGVPQKLSTESVQTHSWDPFFGALIGTAILPQLPEGKHKLTVYLKTYIESDEHPPTIAGEATVYFSIGDQQPPSIAIDALDGSVFNQTYVPLNFSLNEPAVWTAYSLDNSTLATITGNTTLTISPGSHSIILYANDTAGNMGQSEMAHFSVQIPEAAIAQQSEGSIILIALLFVILIASFTVVLFYKQKHPGTEQ